MVNPMARSDRSIDSQCRGEVPVAAFLILASIGGLFPGHLGLLRKAMGYGALKGMSVRRERERQD